MRIRKSELVESLRRITRLPGGVSGDEGPEARGASVTDALRLWAATDPRVGVGLRLLGVETARSTWRSVLAAVYRLQTMYPPPATEGEESPWGVFAELWRGSAESRVSRMGRARSALQRIVRRGVGEGATTVTPPGEVVAALEEVSQRVITLQSQVQGLLGPAEEPYPAKSVQLPRQNRAVSAALGTLLDPPSGEEGRQSALDAWVALELMSDEANALDREHTVRLQAEPGGQPLRLDAARGPYAWSGSGSVAWTWQRSNEEAASTWTVSAWDESRVGAFGVTPLDPPASAGADLAVSIEEEMDGRRYAAELYSNVSERILIAEATGAWPGRWGVLSYTGSNVQTLTDVERAAIRVTEGVYQVVGMDGRSALPSAEIWVYPRISASTSLPLTGWTWRLLPLQVSWRLPATAGVYPTYADRVAAEINSPYLVQDARQPWRVGQRLTGTITGTFRPGERIVGTAGPWSKEGVVVHHDATGVYLMPMLELFTGADLPLTGFSSGATLTSGLSVTVTGLTLDEVDSGQSNMRRYIEAVAQAGGLALMGRTTLTGGALATLDDGMGGVGTQLSLTLGIGEVGFDRMGVWNGDVIVIGGVEYVLDIILSDTTATTLAPGLHVGVPWSLPSPHTIRGVRVVDTGMRWVPEAVDMTGILPGAPGNGRPSGETWGQRSLPTLREGSESGVGSMQAVGVSRSPRSFRTAEELVELWGAAVEEQSGGIARLVAVDEQLDIVEITWVAGVSTVAVPVVVDPVLEPGSMLRVLSGPMVGQRFWIEGVEAGPVWRLDREVGVSGTWKASRHRSALRLEVTEDAVGPYAVLAVSSGVVSTALGWVGGAQVVATTAHVRSTQPIGGYRPGDRLRARLNGSLLDVEVREVGDVDDLGRRFLTVAVQRSASVWEDTTWTTVSAEAVVVEEQESWLRAQARNLPEVSLRVRDVEEWTPSLTLVDRIEEADRLEWHRRVDEVRRVLERTEPPDFPVLASVQTLTNAAQTSGQEWAVAVRGGDVAGLWRSEASQSVWKRFDELLAGSVVPWETTPEENDEEVESVRVRLSVEQDEEEETR